MTHLVDEDDQVVATAWEVLEEEVSEGTKNIRRGTEGETEFVYRIDPEAEENDDIDAEAIRADGEFPDADITLWRAPRDAVKDEVMRRGLAGYAEPEEVDTRKEGSRQH